MGLLCLSGRSSLVISQCDDFLAISCLQCGRRGLANRLRLSLRVVVGVLAIRWYFIVLELCAVLR
jgi:hypothetical protein